MARPGITEPAVHAAADALLAAGERPSTERVRAALGQGSHTTVARWLETWWAQLGPRLARRLALPDLPEPVAVAFAHAWDAALLAGHAHAEACVAPERAALAEVVTRTEAAAAEQQARESAWALQLQLAQAAALAAETARVVGEQRVADLQREIANLTASVSELSRQREAAEARLLAAERRAETDRVAAATEREALQAHLRQAEDRAYGEVDRSRQELKALKAQLTQQGRDHAAAQRASDQGRRAAETAAQRAHRDVAALQKRLDAAIAARVAPPSKVSRTRKASAGV